MAGAGALSRRARARSIAHRWGSVCPLSESEQAVIGVRYDEEDDAAAESFLVKLGPGRADVVDQIPGVALGIAACAGSNVFVLDARGVVHVGGRRHKLSAPRALARHQDRVVLAAADRLWVFSPDGAQVEPGPMIVAKKLAASKAGIVAAADDGRVLFSQGGDGKEIPVVSNNGAVGQIGALAVDDAGRIAAAAGKSMLLGDAGGLKAVAHAPFEIHCVALHEGRALLSSRAHGLFFVDDETNRIMPLKPSLRAHSLVSGYGVLVAASDLFVAITDGVDWLTRDLAPFVRLAEQRLPRFLQSEDPATI